jgi:hypothetical protein
MQDAKDFQTAASLLDRQEEAHTKMENAYLRMFSTGQMIQQRATNAQAQQQSILSDEDAAFRAKAGLAGDWRAVAQVPGRGNERSANLNKIWSAMRVQMEQQNLPQSARIDAENRMRAIGQGQAAESRAYGTREARMTQIINQLEVIIPELKTLSNQVPRGNFVPINKLALVAKENISDPTVARLQAAYLNFAEQWAGSMNAGYQSRIFDKQQALQRLNFAQSPQAFSAALDEVMKIIRIERESIRKGRQEMFSNGTQQQTPQNPQPAQQPAQNDPFGIR